ncbi:MAG: hypothetical protein K6G32_04900 [Prevotella sp.]|nr:hypothetical protein [Prevotella sp.]
MKNYLLFYIFTLLVFFITGCGSDDFKAIDVNADSIIDTDSIIDKDSVVSYSIVGSWFLWSSDSSWSYNYTFDKDGTVEVKNKIDVPHDYYPLAGFYKYSIYIDEKTVKNVLLSGELYIDNH